VSQQTDIASDDEETSSIMMSGNGDRGLGSRLPTHSLVLVGALALSVAGQFVLTSRSDRVLGITLLVTAAMLFLSQRPALSPRTKQPVEETRPLLPSGTWRLLFGASALVAALVAFVGFGNNDLAGGIWFWLGSLLYFVVAAAEVPTAGLQVWLREKWRRLNRRTLVLVIAITLLATFFRAYRLDAVPAEMTSDHAEKLLDVYDVLMGSRPIFFPRNTGREAVQFYLTAALVAWTPLDLGHLALKVGTAIFGIVAVPFTFLLGKELYGRSVGLFAAFFIAVSHWHVAITRVGLRFPFTAAFVAPALYFLVRALRSNQRNDWLAAGLVLGLGLHTYTAMRMVPFLFVLLVISRLFGDLLVRLLRGSRGVPHAGLALSLSFWRNAAVSALAALIAFLPLLRFWLDRPDLFWYRAASRAMGSVSAAELMARFAQNVAGALLMFNVRGDDVPANTIPTSPALGIVAGGFFFLGVAFLLVRLLRRPNYTDVWLLVSFFVLLLPSILSLAFPEENPSAVRTGGAIPLVMIVVALPLVATISRISATGGVSLRAATYVGVALILLAAIADSYDWYFIRYDEHIRRSLWNASEMGLVLKDFAEEAGDLDSAYHIPFPHWVDTRNVGIAAGDVTWRNAVPDIDMLAAHRLDPSAKLYLVHLSDAASLHALQTVYPQGQITLYDSQRPGKDYYIFRVPPR
jgi:hypothetical protein